MSDLSREPEETQIQVLKQAVLDDLYFFAKYILGYWWICEQPHKEFADEIQKDVNMALYLLPRGHCKTQIFNTSDTIRNYLQEPHEPIAIFCDQAKRARWKLRPIDNQFKRNQTLKWLFPDLVWHDPKRQSPKWTEDEIVLPGHTGQQEPSIGAYGLDSMPTSLHFKRIKCDDIVTPEVVTTRAQMAKVRHNYGLVRSSILKPDGNIQICGTIYDDGDLHREMEDSGEYRTYKKAAEWNEIDEDGIKVRKTLWPVQYGPDKLDDIKRDPTVGLYIYSCQYLQDPVPEDENAFFQLGWFQRYKTVPQNLIMFAAGDLAISEADTACDTALVVGGVNYQWDLFIVHIRYGHWGSLEIIDNLIDIQAQYKPGIFTLEAENIQRTIMPFIKIKMRETGIFLNIDAKLPQGDKIAKARPFQGRAKEGAVLLPHRGKGQPAWLYDAEHQIRRFPKGRNKDIVDSIALLCHQIGNQWRPQTAEEIASRQNDVFIPLDEAIGY